VAKYSVSWIRFTVPGDGQATGSGSIWELNSNHNPTKEDVKKTISGVLCICIGYVKITKAIMAAAETLSKQKGEENV